MTPIDKRTRINRRTLECPDPASFKPHDEDRAGAEACSEHHPSASPQQVSNVVYLFSPKTLPLRVRRPRKG